MISRIKLNTYKFYGKSNTYQRGDPLCQKAGKEDQETRIRGIDISLHIREVRSCMFEQLRKGSHDEDGSYTDQ